MTFQILLFFLLICCVFLFDVLAQQIKKAVDSPDICEIISLKLDVVGDTFSKVKKEKSYLVIIGEAPKKVSSRYTSNRISDAIKYLTKFHNINRERIVFGIGLSSKKLAYLKFYVSGELVDEIITRRKGRLCFGMGETFSNTHEDKVKVSKIAHLWNK